MVELFMFQIKKIMDLAYHSQKSNDSIYKKKLTELENEKEALEERLAFGKISENLYRKFQSKIEDKILKLREGYENTTIKISNRQSQQSVTFKRRIINGSEGRKKRIPIKNDEDSDSVHLTDQLSDFRIIPD